MKSWWGGLANFSDIDFEVLEEVSGFAKVSDISFRAF